MQQFFFFLVQKIKYWSHSNYLTTEEYKKWQIYILSKHIFCQSLFPISFIY